MSESDSPEREPKLLDVDVNRELLNGAVDARLSNTNHSTVEDGSGGGKTGSTAGTVTGSSSSNLGGSSSSNLGGSNNTSNNASGNTSKRDSGATFSLDDKQRDTLSLFDHVEASIKELARNKPKTPQILKKYNK